MQQAVDNIKGFFLFFYHLIVSLYHHQVRCVWELTALPSFQSLLTPSTFEEGQNGNGRNGNGRKDGRSGGQGRPGDRHGSGVQFPGCNPLFETGPVSAHVIAGGG